MHARNGGAAPEEGAFPFGEPRWKRVPAAEAVVAALAAADMLPAIYFIFSRVGCDDAALLLHERGLCLTSADEQRAILLDVEALR